MNRRNNYRGIPTRVGLFLASVILAGCTQGPMGPTRVTSDCQLRSFSTGEAIRLSSLKGKTVFFHVWATWCGPCVMELPSVVRLAHQFQDRSDIAFVLVSLDENHRDVERFIADRGLSLPVYTLQSPLPAELHTDGIPATFFIDGAGQIRRRNEGATEWDRKSIVDELNALAAEGKKSESASAKS